MKKIKQNLFSTTPSVLKKGTVAMLCVVMVGLFLFTGCKKDNPSVKSGPGEEPEPEYPIDIPFTEYSLSETCQWVNLDYDNKVIIINSDKELENYISCAESSYPEIDFSKNSLLLASGEVSNGISNITVKNLQQLSLNEYKWDMEILLDDSTIIAITEKWTVALIVEKVSEESKVELNVTVYPIEIPYMEYFVLRHEDYNHCYYSPIDGEWHCKEPFPCWKNLNHDEDDPDFVQWGGKICMINNKEELENYLTCPEEYPVIDFSKQTLVLASNYAASCSHENPDMIFFKDSDNQYTLKATIGDSANDAPSYWCIAILTPKIEDDATLILTIKKY